MTQAEAAHQPAAWASVDVQPKAGPHLDAPAPVSETAAGTLYPRPAPMP